VKSELVEKYQKEVVPAMKAKFGIKNVMAVPRLDKIVVNMGVGEAMSDLKILEVAAEDLAAITGQKPSMRRSKKAISNFHLRIGAPVGCKVTRRREIFVHRVWILRSLSRAATQRRILSY